MDPFPPMSSTQITTNVDRVVFVTNARESGTKVMRTIESKSLFGIDNGDMDHVIIGVLEYLVSSIFTNYPCTRLHNKHLPDQTKFMRTIYIS